MVGIDLIISGFIILYYGKCVFMVYHFGGFYMEEEKSYTLVFSFKEKRTDEGEIHNPDFGAYDKLHKSYSITMPIKERELESLMSSNYQSVLRVKKFLLMSGVRGSVDVKVAFGGCGKCPAWKSSFDWLHSRKNRGFKKIMELNL